MLSSFIPSLSSVFFEPILCYLDFENFYLVKRIFISEYLPNNEFSTLFIFLKASMKISIASIPKLGSFMKLSNDELFEYSETVSISINVVFKN